MPPGRSRSRSPVRRRERPDRDRERLTRDRDARDRGAETRDRARDRERDHRRRDKERPERRERSRSRDRGERRSRSRDRDRERRGSASREKDQPPARPVAKPMLLKRPELTEADFKGKTPEEIEMMKIMGFGGFDSTKGKKVDGNNQGGVHVVLKRRYRQYMNRRGGFNRPLDFVL